MKKVKISLSDLINVFDSGGQEERQYLDTKTGEIIRIFDEALSGIDDTKLEEKIEAGLNVRYFAIPEQDSHEDYEDMADFTRTIEDKNFQEKLEIALDVSGAFRRFKTYCPTISRNATAGSLSRMNESKNAFWSGYTIATSN